MDRKYEIIVYGATGFTGQICCKYLRDNYKDLVWAMAGRNEEKLAQVKSDFNLECDVVVASLVLVVVVVVHMFVTSTHIRIVRLWFHRILAQWFQAHNQQTHYPNKTP